MPADTQSLQSRLDQLGALQAGESVPVDDAGRFMEGVRARGRRRMVVRALRIGGASLAAASLLVVAALALRGSPAPHEDQPGRAVATTDSERPTMALLSRAAAQMGELPGLPAGGNGGTDAPIRSGAVFSAELATRILDAR